jgi:catechol 2,3-dioxygenase-like lactoylglutathione lyase family enzyme
MLSGVSHISLTVTDLDRSRTWYRDILEWDEQLSGRSDTTTFAYGAIPGGTTIVLRAHDEPVAGPFDERRPGLDHLSLAASDAADLADVEARLQQAGASYTPVQELPFAHILAFRDPDNVALELFHTP